MLMVIFCLGNKLATAMLIRCIFLFFIFFTHTVDAKIYSWVDESGQRHYGDEKPQSQKAKEVRVQPNLSGYQMTDPNHKSYQAEQKKQDTLVMYSTAWCGYCKKARAFLSEEKIPFRERNIEKSRKANADYKKLGGRSIPFFSYKGQTHRGFSEYRFMQFYQAQQNTSQTRP